MTETLKQILIDHHMRYPLMTAQDMIKLIYQQTFGARHFSGDFRLEDALNYLEKELELFHAPKDTPDIVYIGNQLYRVSLILILKQKLSKEALARMFKETMDQSPLMSVTLEQTFLKGINILIELIQSRTIDIDMETSMKMISQYLKKGIHPIHHSDTYKKAYHPHYRIVYKHLIPKKLMHENDL